MSCRKIWILLLIMPIVSIGIISCIKDTDPPPPTQPADQTLFIYMPWSSNLTTFFEKNLEDFESAVTNGILQNKSRVIVFFMNRRGDSSTFDATMFELVFNKGKCVRRALKTYHTPPSFTTAEGLTAILGDVKSFAPAHKYSMIVGAHGLGWVTVDTYWRSSGVMQQFKAHWDVDPDAVPLTRFFGGLERTCQTDITTLAKGIADAGMRMEYILFDDCYMSGVEVAYDLRHVTNYLIGCPTEIMAYGMPYHIIGKHLVGQIDYGAICDDFIDFYTTQPMPCGTIGVTNCAEMDRLASVMKEINARFTFDDSLLGSVQTMCGYDPTVFFDYRSYVEKLCPDKDLFKKFENQLKSTVPFSGHTDNYFTALKNPDARLVRIYSFSGITISDPSTHRWAESHPQTGWYMATH